MFDAIPLEMRMFPQWIVWRYEDKESPKPTKVPYSPNGHYLASVTKPEAWGTFEQAVHALQNEFMGYAGIGFVLTPNDPFAFIDLDDTKGDATALERQLKIFNEFDSYAEKSPSGTGLHIIVKGTIPSGRRRSFIEVYSSERYMTMTGDVYRDAPILDCNDKLNALWGQMANGNAAAMVYAGLAEARDTDEAVIKMATGAANGQKFADLFEGKWEGYYPSQSEADFALVDIIAFYTQNRGQIQRLFLASGLGKREKGKRQDYINYMLNKCFDRMLPPVDMDGLFNQLNEAIAKRNPEPVKAIEPPKPLSEIYSLPPGLVGEIAQFIYAQSPRPVAEIALVAALGLMAGIVGRAYNVSNTGLNQYILLLAPTGTGKEGMASGISKLMNAVSRTVPASSEFIGPGEIASPQALTKYFSRDAISFVSMIGEFGIYLKQMASANAAPHQVGLRRMLLDLYNKSGEGNILRPSIYSDKEKNTLTVQAPNLTILGESTPEKFYEALHEGMISEGLLPRFTTIEYYGNRVAFNKAHSQAVPSFELVDKLGTLCAHALMLNSLPQQKTIQVGFTEDAQKYIDEFDIHCDLNINSAEREIRRHLWNRAHIKAMKLAALISVGVNPYNPIITLDVATWAVTIVVADARNLLRRFDAGEIGVDNDETKQLGKVAETIKEYVLAPWNEAVKYAGESFARLHGDKVVPYCYLQRRLSNIAIFRNDKKGSSESIKRALKTLIERGDIQELSKPDMVKKYSSTAVAYMIANVKAFGL